MVAEAPRTDFVWSVWERAPESRRKPQQREYVRVLLRMLISSWLAFPIPFFGERNTTIF